MSEKIHVRAPFDVLVWFQWDNEWEKMRVRMKAVQNRPTVVIRPSAVMLDKLLVNAIAEINKNFVWPIHQDNDSSEALQKLLEVLYQQRLTVKSTLAGDAPEDGWPDDYHELNKIDMFYASSGIEEGYPGTTDVAVDFPAQKPQDWQKYVAHTVKDFQQQLIKLDLVKNPEGGTSYVAPGRIDLSYDYNDSLYSVEVPGPLPYPLRMKVDKFSTVYALLENHVQQATDEIYGNTLPQHVVTSSAKHYNRFLRDQQTHPAWTVADTPLTHRNKFFTDKFRVMALPPVADVEHFLAILRYYYLIMQLRGVVSFESCGELIDLNQEIRWKEYEPQIIETLKRFNSVSHQHEIKTYQENYTKQLDLYEQCAARLNLTK